MKNKILSLFTFWRIVGGLIIITGLYYTYIRFTQGIGAIANLSDESPWGLWIGFDILCGVGLAAGGFTICAVTHIFNIERFKPLTRPAILTAFLGYVLVVVALMVDLGKPWNIWHAIIMWNPRSVMFEVAWCVMLYTTVLFLEFSPVIVERYNLHTLQKILNKIALPVMILGVILSTLHQSSLGSLFLIVPQKMHPLWYTPMLPVYFYLTAIATGFAMVVFESYLSSRAFGKELELPLLSTCGLISVSTLGIYFVMKITELSINGNISYILAGDFLANMFLAEMLVGVIIPAAILLSKHRRRNRTYLYTGIIFVIMGFLMNRMNVGVTSISVYTGTNYFPSIGEISITLMIVVLGMMTFKFAVKNFPVFSAHH